jgi:DNA-binding LacI/PurR family transcriptional regulator
MIERLESKPMVFVGVPTPTTIYVGLSDREDFDKIAARCTDHGEREIGHVLTKQIKSGRRTVIFQFWIKSLTIEAICADLDAKKR